MRKQILAAVMCPLLAVTALAGCGGASGSDTELAADFAYSGTFDQEVYEHAIRDMEINGHGLSMPCTWTELKKAMGKEARLNEEPMVFSKYDLILYMVDYKENLSCDMVFNGRTEKLSEKELKETPVSSLYLQRPTYVYNDLTASIAGVGLWETAESIKKVFGEPTEYVDSENDHDREYYRYNIDENNYIHFTINESKIVDITVSCH